MLDEERIKIADQVLIDIFKELYYPNSCYEFSIVDRTHFKNILTKF